MNVFVTGATGWIEGVPFRAIAEVIGRRPNVPVVAKSPGEAMQHFGWFAGFAMIDAPALIEDLDHPAYFVRNP
jgi:actin-related protein